MAELKARLEFSRPPTGDELSCLLDRLALVVGRMCAAPHDWSKPLNVVVTGAAAPREGETP